METSPRLPKSGYQAVAAAIMAFVGDLHAEGAGGERGIAPSFSLEAPIRYRSGEGPFAELPAAFPRTSETAAGPKNEWGISARYRSRILKTDFNLYWSEFQDRPSPPVPGSAMGQVPTLGDGENPQAHPAGMRLLGAGFRTTLDKASLGTDIQVRRNASFADIAREASPLPGAEPQNKLDYIVSNLVKVRLSAAYALPATALWDSATMRLEFGRQRLTAVSRNAVAIDPGANRHARAVQFVFAPAWSEVLPNLDVSLPVALSYSPKAQAPLPGFDGTYKGGRFSIGASAVYEKTWKADVRYLHYFGEPTSPLKDRNFLWLSIQRSF